MSTKGYGEDPTIQPTNCLVLGAIVATVLMWASSFVIIRWSAPDLSPGPLALLRLLAGAITLTVLILWNRRGRLQLVLGHAT